MTTQQPRGTSGLTGPVEFTDKTPKTAKQLEELRERYRKLFNKELPNSVERSMNAQEPGS